MTIPATDTPDNIRTLADIDRDIAEAETDLFCARMIDNTVRMLSETSKIEHRLGKLRFERRALG